MLTQVIHVDNEDVKIIGTMFNNLAIITKGYLCPNCNHQAAILIKKYNNIQSKCIECEDIQAAHIEWKW